MIHDDDTKTIRDFMARNSNLKTPSVTIVILRAEPHQLLH